MITKQLINVFASIKLKNLPGNQSAESVWLYRFCDSRYTSITTTNHIQARKASSLSRYEVMLINLIYLDIKLG